MQEKYELDIDKRLLSNLTDLAESMKRTTSEVITSLCVDWFSRQDAYIQSVGYVSRPLYEFAMCDDITAKYTMLKGIYDQKHRREWERMTENAAYYGHPLTAEQQEWLDKQRKGHEAQQEHLVAYDKMKKEMDAGRIPADYDGSPEVALSWLAESDAGEITAVMLAERFEAHAKYGGWQGADDGE